jgi:hypothetical protein
MFCGLNGRTFSPRRAKQAAEAGDEQRLADVRAGALQHHRQARQFLARTSLRTRRAGIEVVKARQGCLLQCPLGKLQCPGRDEIGDQGPAPGQEGARFNQKVLCDFSHSHPFGTAIDAHRLHRIECERAGCATLSLV